MDLEAFHSLPRRRLQTGLRRHSLAVSTHFERRPRSSFGTHKGIIPFDHKALHILEIDRLTLLRLPPQQPPRLLLLVLCQDPSCPQPPLLLNLIPNDLRPLYSPPPVLPRQFDLPRHPWLEAHVQKHFLPHSALFLTALGKENLQYIPC